jgi:hypothetical protein
MLNDLDRKLAGKRYRQLRREAGSSDSSRLRPEERASGRVSRRDWVICSFEWGHG